MRFSLAFIGRLLFGFVVIVGALETGTARERGPRVEVVCLSSPIAVKLAEHQVLVYELHITNFDNAPLTLKQLEVFGGPDKSSPLKTITGKDLTAAMLAVGAGGESSDLRTIDSGRRAVVFLWIELSLDARPPVSLGHRMVFTVGKGKAGAAATTVLEDFQVQVNQEPPTLLSPPFEGGVWLAGEGPGNDSSHRTTLVAIDGRIRVAQRFAVDWVKVGPNGDSHHDGTTRNENWWGYGEPLHAVADGEVTQIMDGIPENKPRVLPATVTLDNIAGNYVTLRIAPNRYVTYAHLQTGSIKVGLHEHVSRGTVIANLGNTGQATAPHLHLQVTDGNSVLDSEGVPFIFGKFTDLGPGSAYELDKHISVPRTDSIPGKDEVIDFSASNKQ